MRHIVFTPDRNKISNDYVGAFEPEALRYASYWAGQGDEVTIHKMAPMSAERSVLKMLEVIEAAGNVDRLVFFCHGWKTGIQMGLSCGDDKGRDTLATFCTRLVAASTPQLKVALYACSTGASSTSVTGDGGFADALRDGLCKAGRADVTVFAHTTAGHTSRNEYVRFFSGKGDPLGGVGGDDVVARKTPEFAKLRERLHEVKDDFRWRLPYLGADEIHKELS